MSTTLARHSRGQRAATPNVVTGPEFPPPTPHACLRPEIPPPTSRASPIHVCSSPFVWTSNFMLGPKDNAES